MVGGCSLGGGGGVPWLWGAPMVGGCSQGWGMCPWLGNAPLVEECSHGWVMLPWLGGAPLVGRHSHGCGMLPWLGDSPPRVWLYTEKVLPISTALLVLGVGLGPPSCPESHRDTTRAVEASQWEGQCLNGARLPSHPTPSTRGLSSLSTERRPIKDFAAADTLKAFVKSTDMRCSLIL